MPALSTPEIVAPFAGDLYQTPSAPLNGAGVGVPLVGVGVGLGVGDGVGEGVGDGVGEGVGDGVGEGVGDGVGDGVTVPVLLTVTLMSASDVLPPASNAIARRVYCPSGSLVVGKSQLKGAL